MSEPYVLKKLSTYFKRVTGVLPDSMSSLDSTRLVVLYFGISGLALIQEEDEPRINDFIEWVYLHQITLPSDHNLPRGGFRSVLYTAPKHSIEEAKFDASYYDSSHVTMVYAALCTLITLGDDLSRVDRHSVLSGIAALQREDVPGLFKAGFVCSESDMRFVFSAVASCYILDGLDYLDREAIVSFIGDSLTYEGGFGNLPGLEAHAGATYCALASLSLLGLLTEFLPVGSKAYERLIRWLVNLQTEGFHGRPQKTDDTCYTFWVCASLKLLNAEALINHTALLKFVSSCWDEVVGGIQKYSTVKMSPDPLHSYLALSGLACLGSELYPINPTHITDGDSATKTEDTVRDRVEQFRWLHSNRLVPIQPELNITKVAFEHLKRIHNKWKTASKNA